MVQVMNTAVMRSEWVGRTIEGRFPLIECLGDSRSSVVFRTELPGPPKKRAAIRLVPVDGEDPRSMMKEWEAATLLSHPHLMKIYFSGQGEVDGIRLLYLVTEFAEENLAQIIPERPLTPDEVREMLPPVVDALLYLHARGMVFGHLKPSNIMVVDNQLKLPLDGMAGGAGTKTQAEPRIYDAPETAIGPTSPASDVWSLGVTLVEALTQRLPVWERSTRGNPLMPASVPQPFADIVRDCLRLDPGDRPTLRAIRTRLEGGDTSPVPATERDTGPIPAAKVTVVSVPVSEPVSPARPEPEPAPRTSLQGPRRSAGSNRGLIWLGAGGVVVLAMIAFFTARGHRSEAPAPTVTQMPAATAPAPQAAVPQPPAVQSPASNGSPVKGEATERVMADVSSSASRTIHGKVVVKVRVTVDPNGVVSGASIRSAGSRYFGAKALEAARKWRFRPPQANSQAVASEWTLEFIFRQNGSSVNPVQVTP
jgi:TonB family protein